MTPPTRADAQARLAEASAALAGALAGATDESLSAARYSEAWSALDLLRHIEVWAELASRCLSDWHGPRDWILTFADEDQFNQEMVAMRAGWDTATVVSAIASAYESYEATLAGASDAELADEDAAPWGQRVTRLQLIAGSLEHDMEHIGQLAAALRGRAG